LIVSRSHIGTPARRRAGGPAVRAAKRLLRGAPYENGVGWGSPMPRVSRLVIARVRRSLIAYSGPPPIGTAPESFWCCPRVARLQVAAIRPVRCVRRSFARPHLDESGLRHGRPERAGRIGPTLSGVISEEGKAASERNQAAAARFRHWSADHPSAQPMRVRLAEYPSRRRHRQDKRGDAAFPRREAGGPRRPDRSGPHGPSRFPGPSSARVPRAQAGAQTTRPLRTDEGSK
jgi:hypothetical protein